MSPSLLDDGVYPGISRERYDAIDRVNFSSLKWFSTCAAKYRHHTRVRQDAPGGTLNPAEDTDAMALGRAVHIAVFEPETFDARVVRWDGGTRRGKTWDAFCAQHAGKEILTEAAWAKCWGIRASVLADPLAKQYLTGGIGELTALFTAQSTETGADIAARLRLDFDQAKALVDLKTTSDSEPEAFGGQVCNLNYDAQAAWYSDGYFAVTGIRKPYKLIAVESEPPYVVTVLNVTRRSIDLGRETYQKWLNQLAWCREHGRWPSYTGGAEVDLPIPYWRDPDGEEKELLGGLTSGGKALHLERD